MFNIKKMGLCIALLVIFLPVLFLSVNSARAEIVYEYDFETGWDDWWADNGVWGVGVPTSGPESSHSPVNCAATNLDGNYPLYTGSRLVSPSLDLPEVAAGQEIVLRFWHWFSYYNEKYTTDDRGQVQVKTYENGVWSDWEALLTVSLSSPVWSTAQVDLSAHAGKRVRVGFLHQDYRVATGSGESTGWYIDDIEIVYLGDCEPPFKVDIKVNGSNNTVVVSPSNSVSVTVELEDGEYTGTEVDWWIGVTSTIGTYWYNSLGNWELSNSPVLYSQDPLHGVPETTVLEAKLPVGIYTFFFVLDFPSDGIFGITRADYVNVFCKW